MNMKIERKMLIAVNSLIIGFLLGGFAMSKLIELEDVEKYNFQVVTKVIDINLPTIRLIIGIAILTVSLAYILSAVISFLKIIRFKKITPLEYNIILIADVFGILVMILALIVEFVLRIEPKLKLVKVEVGIIFFSLLCLKLINNQINFNSKK